MEVGKELLMSISSISGVSNSFEKIMQEFEANVPDQTSTISEKEKALSYIKQIQSSDASDELKLYWENKADVIEGEISEIQNNKSNSTTTSTTASNTSQSNSSSKKESADEIMKEFNANVPDQTSTIEEKELALSYIERIENSDADDNTKLYWQNKATVIQGEISKIQAETSGDSSKVQKESFNKIFSEMEVNLPGITSTVEEKELALSYIERIENSDADESTKTYWQNIAEQIQNEIYTLNTQQVAENKSTKNQSIKYHFIK